MMIMMMIVTPRIATCFIEACVPHSLNINFCKIIFRQALALPKGTNVQHVSRVTRAMALEFDAKDCASYLPEGVQRCMQRGICYELLN